MRVLYLDSLFWLELIADSVLLWAAGKLCHARRKALRLLAAGLLGSGYTLLTLFLPPAASIGGRLAALLAMLLTAYGGEKRLWRIALAFLFLCAVYGGLAWAVTLAAGKATARALIFSVGVSLGACALPFRFSGASGGVCELRLIGSGGEVRLHALRDTGDRLIDPFSGKPVVISSEEELAPLFPEKTQRDLARTAGLPPEERLEILGRGFCLLPLHTVGGGCLALSGKVENAYLDGEALGPCRVVFSREPIQSEGCNALISG